MYGYIYMTTNKINNRKYIGQHKGEFDENYYGSGLIISQALQKYGYENFEVKVIEKCETKSELNECEKKWIKHFNAVNSKEFYNIAKGGDGGHTIAGYNEEQMQRYHDNMSKALKGKKFSEEHKRKISESLKNANLDRCGEKNSFYGRHHSEETRKKLSESMSKRTGWNHKEDTKRKIGEKNKKRILFELNDKRIEFDSRTELDKFILKNYNMGPRTVTNILKSSKPYFSIRKDFEELFGLKLSYLERE